MKKWILVETKLLKLSFGYLHYSKSYAKRDRETKENPQQKF